MSLARKIFSVGIWTGASRILGFVRDMLIGRYLGAGRLSDIFLTAFKLPNLFRDLLGEGVLSSVFIPMFSKNKKSENFAANAFSWLMLVLLIITIVVEIFMPFVVLGLAPGFDVAKLQDTVLIARIMFFYCILVCGSSFLSAILNAFSDFALAAAVPILLNVFLIGELLIFGANLYAQSIAVLLTGVLQMWVLWRRLHQRKFGLRLVYPRLTPLVKQMMRRFSWGFLGTGFYQINIIVGVMVASFQSGAVSYLYYSDRLVQLPFAIIGLASGTVILTKIADALTAKKLSAVFKYQHAAIRSSMMFTLPAMVGLAVLAEPIVRVLFEYGKWEHSATIGVAAAIIIQALVLPFMTNSQIYTKTLYASGDAKTPVKVSALALGVGVIVMAGLVHFIGYLCVPIGTLISGLLRNIALKRVCLRRGLYQGSKNTNKAVWAFLILSLFMGVGLFFARGMINSVPTLAMVLGAAAIIYLPSALFCDKIVKR